MSDTDVDRMHMARVFRRQPAACLVEHLTHPKRPLSDDIKAALETVLAEKRALPREAA